MVDTIIIGMEELLLFVPFGGSMHCKRSWFHEVCDKSYQPCMLAHGNRTRCVPARLSQCPIPSFAICILLYNTGAGCHRLRNIPVPGVSAEMPNSQFRAQPGWGNLGRLHEQ